MTPDQEAVVQDIIAALEKATEESRELDAQIWLLVTPGATRCATPVDHPKGRYVIDETRDASGRLIIVPAYTTSLDAALTLVPAGMVVNLGNDTNFWAHVWTDTQNYHGTPHDGLAATMPLALCIAALRAIASRSAT